MTVTISKPASGKRPSIRLTGVHKQRMLKVLASKAKANKKLRDAVRSTRAASAA